MAGRPLQQVIPAWSAVADSLLPEDDGAPSGARASAVPVDVAGRELWLSISAVGLDEGSVFAFHDLSEERALEQLKADFIATVSHELRTPLAAVHGAAKTLLRDDVDLGHDVSRQLLTLVSEQSDRLAAQDFETDAADDSAFLKALDDGADGEAPIVRIRLSGGLCRARLRRGCLTARKRQQFAHDPFRSLGEAPAG